MFKKINNTCKREVSVNMAGPITHVPTNHQLGIPPSPAVSLTLEATSTDTNMDGRFRAAPLMVIHATLRYCSCWAIHTSGLTPVPAQSCSTRSRLATLYRYWSRTCDLCYHSRLRRSRSRRLPPYIISDYASSSTSCAFVAEPCWKHTRTLQWHCCFCDNTIYGFSVLFTAAGQVAHQPDTYIGIPCMCLLHAFP